ncbi:hypothetical protein GIB67_018722 [Kingdonia uniflora]|uniref:Major facilitator superfamily (MFS) profile domain-containing protein n=1 Tax=Kingdonia uniflora TaxID=39325 RepID=A0A7J7L2A7_9MAGN|nr:hypothetical protein GIB67_018722 [Kingdonia uniflora]
MVEGGVSHKAGKIEFSDCFRLSRSNPYILQLALSARIGGLRFVYDTGVISGALLYIRDDFQKLIGALLCSMVVVGAIVGAAISGWMNDSWRRRISILIVDVLFVIGAIVLGIAPSPNFIILGRVFVGLGVGMASMTVPLYISEASPTKIRGALVTLKGLLITGGQFIAYFVNLAFAHINGTWRWMLEVAAVPVITQFILMMFLPESPRWLYRKDRKEEAAIILKKLCPPHEVEAEVEDLRLSVEAEIAEEGSIGAGNIFTKTRTHEAIPYSTIVQLAGYASNSMALTLSLITSGLNAFGSIVSMLCVDRYGRRKLPLVRMVGIITCLLMLTGVFEYAKKHAPALKPGACLAFASKETCQTGAREWYSGGCPNNVELLAVLLLGLYILAYFPGMGTVPWIVNSEIDPLRHRGICGGMAVVANWVSNLIVSQTFLSLTEALGSGYTFMLFGFISSGALVYLYMFVPETKGLAFEEVEKKLVRTWKTWENHSDDEDSTSGKAVP